MKKSLVRLVAMVLLMCFSSVFFACGGGEGEEPTPAPVCEHNYRVFEDRPHTDPEEYGTLVMKCTLCDDSYEQQYFGHSIKGCDLAPSFGTKPSNTEECAYCHDLSNHTCPCGTVCDVNVFYRYFGGKVAIYGSYFYLDGNGNKKSYFPETDNNYLGPEVRVASVFGGAIVTEIDANGLGPIGWYRHIFYFTGLCEKIGDYAASKFNVMKGAWFPKTLKEIGSQAFYSNERMATILYEGTMAEFDRIIKASNWIGGESYGAEAGHYNGGEGCRLYASDGNYLLNP